MLILTSHLAPFDLSSASSLKEEFKLLNLSALDFIQVAATSEKRMATLAAATY